MVAGAFHRIDEPIPVPGGLDGDLAARWEFVQEMSVFLPKMLDTNGPGCVPSLVDCYKD
jgi:hypothetical protein